MHSHSQYHTTTRLVKAARAASHQCSPGWCPFCFKQCDKSSEGWAGMLHLVLAIVMIALIMYAAFQTER